MSLRWRLIILLLATYSVGGYVLLHWALGQIRPRYLESMEESLVDVAVLLSTLAAPGPGGSTPDVAALDRVVNPATAAELDVRIFSLRKTHLDIRIYAVDRTGRVIFDSTGRDVGEDYSQWRDVARTLRGEYGARATRDDPDDETTLALYVAAPVRADDEIVGAVTVAKPTRAIAGLVDAARARLVVGAIVGGCALLIVLLFAASTIIAPIERLTAYVRAVRDGARPAAPRLPSHSLQELGRAFEEMRDALEGRQSAERYTQTLAHGLKAPLAAIQGAAELMDEAMPEEQRRRFMRNIREEAERIRLILERLLELSSLESRKSLSEARVLATDEWLGEALRAMDAAAAARGVQLDLAFDEDVQVRGDPVLLREAVVNLLQNAVEFSSPGDRVSIHRSRDRDRVVVAVQDRGPGVPDFALARVFERFYSLPRPGGTRKSTGLGLTLAREIAKLHGGDVTLANSVSGGAVASLHLPVIERG